MSGKITDLTAIPAIDRTADLLEIVDVSANASYNVTVNNLIGISGGSAVSTTDTQTVQNKTFDNTNAITVTAANLLVEDGSDTTKQLQFSLTSITTGNKRTLTVPDASGTIVLASMAQTLSNKTLTSPVITGGSIDASTVTIDALAGHTAANSGTVYGITVASGVITTSNSIAPAALATGISASKFSNAVKFRVYRNAALTLTATTATEMPMDTKDYDTGTNVDVVTNKGRFTAPINGFYHFDGRWGATTTTLRAFLYKNGSLVSTGSDMTQSSAAGGAAVTDNLQLSASDYVELWYYAGTAASVQNTIDSTRFSGFLISAT